MNKNIHYCFIFFILLIGGCVSSNEDVNKENSFKYRISLKDAVVDEFNYDDLIDSIFIVRLEMNESCLLKEIKKVVFHKNTCFVLDEMGVYAFSLSGDFIQKIGAIGRGPGEYISSFDVSLSDSLLYIYDNHGSKIHCYNANNYGYINSYSQTNSGTETVVKGDYVFGKGVLGKTNLKSRSLVQEDDEELTLFNIEPDEFDLQMYNQILTSNNKHFWIDPLRCEIYELNDSGRVTPYLKLYEPEVIVTEEELKSITTPNEIEQQGKITNFNEYYETSNYQVVKYIKNAKFWIIFRNKKLNKLYHFDIFETRLSFSQPFSSINGVYNDFFVSVKNNLTDLLWLYNYNIKESGDYEGVYSAFNDLKNVNENDNPVLIFARFK